MSSPSTVRHRRAEAAAPRSRSATPRHFRGGNYRIEDSIGYLLRLTVSAIKRRLDLQIVDHGMTGVQMLPLLAIDRSLCRTAAELSRLYDTDPGATTRMIDRLESKGLLKRVRSVQDRRVVQLELTSAGRVIARKIPYAIAEVLNDVLRDFSATEVDTLRSLLRRIIANAEVAG